MFILMCIESTVVHVLLPVADALVVGKLLANGKPTKDHRVIAIIAYFFVD